MAWLSGYSKRIKVTADRTKVGSDLSWFPLTIFLKSGNGDTSKVFTELGSNNLKMAVTKSDGTTQLYVEIEKWDTTNSIGVLHCGLDGDTLSSSTDTDYYIYYDKNQPDNTSYVGGKNSTPAQYVWDSNFKCVLHLDDGANNSSIFDSTANNNDGTKVGANEPNKVDTIVGNGQEFDGSNDYIDLGTNLSLANSNFTISAVLWVDTKSGTHHLVCCPIDQDAQYFFGSDGNQLFCGFRDTSNTWKAATVPDANWNTATWYHLMGTWNGSTLRIYLNGVEYNSETPSSRKSNVGHTYIGIGNPSSNYRPFDGKATEIRISNTNRSQNWAKVEYYSLFDTLLTYGTEETAPANFFPFF